MKFVSNAGTDRVLDLVRPWLKADNGLDMVSPTFSLFAFAEVLADAAKLSNVRVVLPAGQAANGDELDLLGSAKDRAARNKLQGPWLARKLAAWLEQKANVRQATGGIPQGTLVLRDASGTAQQAVLGSFSFSTEGLGLTPGNPLSLIQASETPAEAQMLSQWFDAQWASLKEQPEAKAVLVERIKALAAHRDPLSVYVLILHHLFTAVGDGMD